MLMSMKEYANYAGISYQKIYRMCRAGELPYIKFGNQRRIDTDEAARKLKAAEQKHQEEKHQPTTARPLGRIRTKSEFMAALKAL